MTLQKLENESMLDYKYRLLIGKSKGEIEESWQEVFNALNIGLGIDSVKKGTIFLPEFEEYMINKLSPNTETPSYRETIELKKDGTTSSDKLIELSHAQMKDSEYILKAHGFNPLHFDLVGAKHSVWNVSAGNNPNKTLYASKVSVKPKVERFDMESFITKLEKINRKFVDTPIDKGDRLLVLPFVDMHFGINSYSDYEELLNETVVKIRSRLWDTIYIPIGNDLLHHNNHKGQTANGTQIEVIDLDYATEEALKFYTVIYEEALQNSNNVVSDYIPGNHDSDISWMFVKMLMKTYPQIKSDTSMEVKKLFKWKNILLCNLHGERGLARVVKALVSEYRDMVVGAKTVEVHSGHLHSEKVKDEYGILVRTLPTNAATDAWHRDNSFEGAVKTAQLFEYDENKLKGITYV